MVVLKSDMQHIIASVDAAGMDSYTHTILLVTHSLKYSSRYTINQLKLKLSKSQNLMGLTSLFNELYL